MDNGVLLVRSGVKMFYEGKVNLNFKIKERFREVCLKVGEVFGNEKLEIMDRILVCYVKVMVILLEDVDDDFFRVILFCKDFLVEMNLMKVVSKNFVFEILILSLLYEKVLCMLIRNVELILFGLFVM